MLPHYTADDFNEPWRHQNWTNIESEHNVSDWQKWQDNDDHSVARTSAKASKFAVAYGTLQDANRRMSNGYWQNVKPLMRANSEDAAYYKLRRAAYARRRG